MTAKLEPTAGNMTVKTDVEAPCGCKGIRYCAQCIDTERVRKLNLTTDEKYRDYNIYIYNQAHGKAYECASMNWRSTAAEISKAAASQLPSAPSNSQEALVVDGLLLVPDFITEGEESTLVSQIDSKEWVLSQSGRRKQDHGPKVNFKHKKIKTEAFTGLPAYADFLLNKMRAVSEEKLGSYQPFELCNLEYSEERLSAIEMHQDDMWIWGNRLISLNLINGSIMTLENEEKKALMFVVMPRRSLLCMYNEARYQWKHGIFSWHIHGRRIALTMREPSPLFQEGGELYEKYGQELIRRGGIRL
ncbi:Protein F09F7.7 a [Aphelenchoides avenae]|nr:Protein F09F7.7 a [Aphelenchus avenae]